MFAKSKAAAGLVATFIVTFTAMNLGFWLARDCYGAPRIQQFSISLIVALAVGALFLFLGLARPPSASTRSATPRQQATVFVIFWFTTTWNCVAAVPRFIADRTMTSQVAYMKVQGRKNCAFGIQFVDAGGAGTIEVCGPRWHLPSDPERGMLRVTERIGVFGVYLENVEAVIL